MAVANTLMNSVVVPERVLCRMPASLSRSPRASIPSRSCALPPPSRISSRPRTVSLSLPDQSAPASRDALTALRNAAVAQATKRPSRRHGTHARDRTTMSIDARIAIAKAAWRSVPSQLKLLGKNKDETWPASPTREAT